ncbi:hypothetical protein [Micromonospora endolithica]|nr:hypothetical protein [Micromonospora endolithica]
MGRIVWPDQRGLWSLLGGIVVGAVLAVVFFRAVTVQDGWMALVPVAAAVTFAAIPYRHGPGGGRAPHAPWRYAVLALGLTLAVAALTAAIAGR